MNWRDRPPGGRIPFDESLPNHPIDNLLLEKLRRCSLWQVMHPLTFLSYLASVTYSSTKQVSRSSPSMSREAFANSSSKGDGHLSQFFNNH